MTESYDEISDWEALRKFRTLTTDSERLEQMFMTSLGAARTSKANTKTLVDLDRKVGIQNGRVGKLETRWIQGAAVVAFLLVVIPILLASVALLIR